MCGVMYISILLQKDLVTAAQRPWKRNSSNQALGHPPAKEAACSISGEKASFQLAIMLACLPYTPGLFGSSEHALCGFGNSFTGFPPPQANPTRRHPELALHRKEVPLYHLCASGDFLHPLNPPEKQPRRVSCFFRLFCPWGTGPVKLHLLFLHPTLHWFVLSHWLLCHHTLHIQTAHRKSPTCCCAPPSTKLGSFWLVTTKLTSQLLLAGLFLTLIYPSLLWHHCSLQQGVNYLTQITLSTQPLMTSAPSTWSVSWTARAKWKVITFVEHFPSLCIDLSRLDPTSLLTSTAFPGGLSRF